MTENQGLETRSRRKRPTIGLLIDHTLEMEEGYHSAILAGVITMARKRDVNLLCFTGGALHGSPFVRFDSQRNLLYEMINDESVDGLVIIGTVGNYAPLEELRRLHVRYHPLPTVSIGTPLEGIPSLIVDNDNGLRHALCHLIERHDRRHIAFIRGPEDNRAAQLRYSVFTEVLAQYDIPLNRDLVAPGNFSSLAGAEAMQLLLDQRQVRFEAVVAANDDMALGALEELQARGIDVPYDVAVIGFDDIQQAATAIPSLTTVRQPLPTLGRQAVEILLAQIDNKTVSDNIMFPTELVVRRSCGCLEPVVTRGAGKPATEASETIAQILTTKRAAILADLSQAIGLFTADTSEWGPSESWDRQLLDSFSSDVKGQPGGLFLSTLDRILRQALKKERDIDSWQTVVAVLSGYTRPGLANDNLSFRAESLLYQAQILISEAGRKALMQQYLQIEHQNVILRDIGQSLITTFDLAKLMDLIAESMPRLGIPSCYLALYDDPQPYRYPQSPSEWSRLVLAYNLNGRLELPPHGRYFRSQRLLPAGTLPHDRQFTMIVEPLYFRREQIGFALFERGPREINVYETLRGQISSALKGALLLQVHKDAEEEIREHRDRLDVLVQQRTILLRREIGDRQRAEEQLKAYTGRLEEMVEERTKDLQDAQERLIRQEKLALLGQLAGGIGHELRNPLGVISNAVYFLQMILPDADDTVKEYLGIISARVRESERTVTALLNLSRTQPTAREKIKVSALVAEALSRCLPPENITVETELAPNLPPVSIDPQQIGQVLNNLITNAYQAMPNGGTLTIKAQAEQQHVNLSIADTGHGMSPETMKKIFEPLYTTRVRGIGLGLALAKNLVAVNGGQIGVESIEGQGTTFFITLLTEVVG